MKWISVKDRLPDTFDDVLGYDGERMCVVCAYVYDDKKYIGPNLEYNEFGTITHWMPLPQPPKE